MFQQSQLIWKCLVISLLPIMLKEGLNSVIWKSLCFEPHIFIAYNFCIWIFRSPWVHNNLFILFLIETSTEDGWNEEKEFEQQWQWKYKWPFGFPLLAFKVVMGLNAVLCHLLCYLSAVLALLWIKVKCFVGCYIDSLPSSYRGLLFGSNPRVSLVDKVRKGLAHGEVISLKAVSLPY